MSPDPSRTLVVSCPHWPVLALGPRRDAAVAVVEAGRVIDASSAARAEGVRAGQRRKDAESRCPGIVCVTRDPGAELRAFESVVARLETFGVAVMLRRPGWAAFATRGPSRRLGGEAALAAAVGEAVRAVFADSPLLAGALAAEGYPAGAGTALQGAGWRIGVADGAFAATLAAHEARIVPHEETERFLAAHPVAALERPELVEILERLGIHTLGELGALERSQVLARFGPDGATAHDLARGVVLAGPPPRRARPDFVVETAFEEPAETVEAAVLRAKGLAERLCEDLAAAGYAASVVVVEASTTEGERIERRWSHDGPWRAPLITERLRWQLDAWLTPLGSPSLEAAGSSIPRGIDRLRLLAEEVVPASGVQGGLFGRPPGGNERVERLVARVQRMLGPDGVQRAFVVGGRGPAERVQLVAFGDPPPPARAAELPWPGQLPAPNPALVFADPPPVSLTDAAGEAVRVDGRGQLLAPPARLSGLPGTEEEAVTEWAGPWPLDERWWDRAGRRRRARLQVLTSAGGYLLALERGSWRLEGRYD